MTRRRLLLAGTLVILGAAVYRYLPGALYELEYPAQPPETLEAIETGDVALAAVVDGTYTFSPGVDEHTPFRIGSVSKPFTAALVILLANEGRIDLDAPISDYVDVPSKASVRDVLRHRGGISDPGDHWFERAYDHQNEPIDRQQFVQEADWAGRGFEYSNVGYVVLGELVEAVENRPVADVMRERIFEPLDLEDTCWPSLEPSCRSIPGIVDTEEFGRDPSVVEPIDTFVSIDLLAGGAGALVSSLSDLERFASAVFTDQLGDLSLMRETRNSGFLFWLIGIRYGAGAMRFHDGSIGHLGQTIGFQALVRYQPSNGNVNVVLVGHSSIDPLAVEAELAAASG